MKRNLKDGIGGHSNDRDRSDVEDPDYVISVNVFPVSLS